MIPCITEKKLQELKKLIDTANKPAILAHMRPDGDALGSTAGMCRCLRELCGKDAVCILPDAAPDNLVFIIDGLDYVFADRQPERALAEIAGADLLILLDCNSFSRTEQLEEACKASTAPKVLIDHHLNPAEGDFSLVFSTPDISSASELLYWILSGIFGRKLPVGAREALLSGMTTDTNNFGNSVFPSTLRMASELIEDGTDRSAILYSIYNNYRENRIRLMGHMQHREMKILPEGVAYMILSSEIQKEFDYREGEADGLVNVPLAIGKVRMSILVTEKADVWRISIRSKIGTSAQGMAQRFFHGGGHENAAGGKLVPGEDVLTAADIPAYIENAVKTFFDK